MKTTKNATTTKSSKGKRMSEDQIRAKYPHVIKGSLKFDSNTNKQTVEAKLECGHKERLYTSDLFQVKRCDECSKSKAKTAKKATRGKAADAKPVKAKMARRASAPASAPVEAPVAAV